MVCKTSSSFIVEIIGIGTNSCENPTNSKACSVRAVTMAIAAEATLGVIEVVPQQLPHPMDPLTSTARRYRLVVGSTFCENAGNI